MTVEEGSIAQKRPLNPGEGGLGRIH
jgi:hypothetical protein